MIGELLDTHDASHRRAFVTIGGHERCEDCARISRGWTTCPICKVESPMYGCGRHVQCRPCLGTGMVEGLGDECFAEECCCEPVDEICEACDGVGLVEKGQ